MPPLCPVCAQIPYQALTCPTVSDVRKVHEGRKKVIDTQTVFFPFDASSDVELGSLRKLKSRAQGCQLCSLFYNTIKRRGSQYGNNWPIPEDDDNIIIRTGCDWFHSFITETMGASPSQALVGLRRLALLVHVAAATEISGVIWKPRDNLLACYTNVVQPCHIDDFLQAPGPGSIPGPEGQPRLLFCARQRPDMVDIQLLLRWMNICRRDHDLSCSAEDEEDERRSLACVK